MGIPSCENRVFGFTAAAVQSGGSAPEPKPPENAHTSDQVGDFCVDDLPVGPGQLVRGSNRDWNAVVCVSLRSVDHLKNISVSDCFHGTPGAVSGAPLDQDMLAITSFVVKHRYSGALDACRQLPTERGVKLPVSLRVR